MRAGLELELLAPAGARRDDLAARIAGAVGGRVCFGLKHIVDGELAPGRPRCTLSFAARVEDAGGRWLCDLVDDVTVREGLPADGPRAPLVVIDDTRVAKWLEARAFGPGAALADRLAPLLHTFAATLQPGAPARVVDPWGQVLAVVIDEPASHHRVCEVVTRPLDDHERAAVLTDVLAHANALGFVVPAEAALHAHFDAAPWRDTARLRRLILDYTAEREAIRQRLQPNPRCRRLGPFPPQVVRAAREAPTDLPFPTFAAALLLAGAHKACDVNLLGVIDTHPVQPTLEVRCLPMSLHADQVLASVAAAEAALLACTEAG